MMPISERVFAVIEQRLAVAPVDACGCRWSVHRSRRSLTEGDLPAAVVWDDGETVAPETGGGAHASLTVTQRIAVEVHVPASARDTGQRLGLAKAAAKVALCVDKGRVADADGVIGVLTYTGADASARADGANSEAVSLHFEAIYKEAYGDPTRPR